MKKLRYRTVFVSDVHLGTNGCHAKDLSRLLRRIDCQRLYLVGDIIDMWRLRQRWYWPSDHNDVIRRLLKIAGKTEVIFIPGNHDEAARQYCGLEFGGVRVEHDAIHTNADGRRLLVVHGDEFDMVVKHSPWLARLGAWAYSWLTTLNTWYNKLRSLFGLQYWSLAAYIKLKVKHACTFISSFEKTLARAAIHQGVEGVVCGHIHKAEVRTLEGVAYYNCGDWVESCTLLVEHDDGRMELIDGLKLLENLRKRKNRNAADEPAEESADENDDLGPNDGSLEPFMPSSWVADHEPAATSQN
ncbi:UDP-2,3-diacylglucosamine diphosphatase [Mucisphaera calidilacus]|uniref:UDP-2,3-diacylglucosamine hydrolase n=1 Tax=Mucisphaera calidilacus TaxID=2527982 RepID=A0A518BYB1_9BACT|nr:UDP-2,3-diacylglucosamine diphosphatase [Mucisphaera calidilacus]QDU71965.1 UDP-2,3-diacylglucosamine hydrolase [Mucisphaera calidilacus]